MLTYSSLAVFCICAPLRNKAFIAGVLAAAVVEELAVRIINLLDNLVMTFTAC